MFQYNMHTHEHQHTQFFRYLTGPRLLPKEVTVLSNVTLRIWEKVLEELDKEGMDRN